MATTRKYHPLTNDQFEQGVERIVEALNRNTAALLTAVIAVAFAPERPTELTDNPYRWAIKTYEKLRDDVVE